MKNHPCTRRAFLRWGAAVVSTTPFAFSAARNLFAAEAAAATTPLRPDRSRAKVAIVECRGYGPEVRKAFDQSFDFLGGLGSLVQNKTVTIKVNLTGTNFAPFLDRPVGETYMT